MMVLHIAMKRLLALGALLALAGAVAAQPAFPSKPVRLIVPYPPGATTTILAHLLAEKLGPGLGQTVVVDNRPGGNTTIGSEALVKSAPDGYTIFLATSSHLVVPQLIKTSYDPVRDFAPVATICETEFVLSLNPSVPANTVQELIALAKAKPGQLNYATAGSGTSTHLTHEYFHMVAGIKMLHVPYKGGGPALLDVIGGQVQMSFLTPAAALPHLKTGKLKALAISGAKRSSALPDVPTFAEAGLPGFQSSLWYGIFAPAGTPAAAIDRLSAEFAKVLALPDVSKKLSDQGLNPLISTPAQFRAIIQDDYSKWGKVIKSGNVTM